MKLFDKILLAALSALAVTAVILLLVLGSPFEPAWLWIVCILGVLILACTVRMLFVVFKKDTSAQSVMLVSGENGVAHMSFAAIEGVVRTLLGKQPQIKSSRIQVCAGKDNSVELKLQLHLIEQVMVAPFVSNIQQQIAQQVETFCGVRVSHIYAVVESAAEPDPGKGSDRPRLK